MLLLRTGHVLASRCCCGAYCLVATATRRRCHVLVDLELGLYVKERERQTAYDERETQDAEHFAVLLMVALFLHEILVQTFVRVHFVVVHFEKSNDPNVGDEHGQTGQDELEHEQDEYVDALVDRVGPVLGAVDRVLSFHNNA